MSFVDVILKKRYGGALSRDEIVSFVDGVTAGLLPDYQIAALLMAIVLRGMTVEETSCLTTAMRDSGDRLDLSDVPGVKVGKHSTGGVGDKVSLVLAPVAAACGVVVPKMSGRGLGHTGGTLDKLESIPGFRVDIPFAEFKRILADVGTSIIGQSAHLVPADKKLYALRDVTGTVSSIPLIAASIMSKKLAEGSDALVLDVKCGDGAFMKDEGEARALAELMVRIGAQSGLRAEAIITDMEVPLGSAVGNALEVVEAIEALKGRAAPDFAAVVARLASRMIVLAGVERSMAAAEARVAGAIASGAAVDRFRRMVERQGGDAAVFDDYRLLPTAPDRTMFAASRGGVVTTVHALAVGMAAGALGAGRTRVDDAVDHAVGVVVHVRPGDRVAAGDPLIELHHRGGRGLEGALSLCAAAVVVGDESPAPRPAVLAEIRGADLEPRE